MTEYRFNPSDKNANFTLSNGNKTATYGTGVSWGSARCYPALSSGKWYFEFIFSGTDSNMMFGVASSSVSLGSHIGGAATGWAYYANNGYKWNGGSNTTYGSAFSAGDKIGVAIDFTAGKIWFSKNNTWQNSGNPPTGANPAFSNVTGAVYPAVSAYSYSGGVVPVINVFAIASELNYTPPNGFSALFNDASKKLAMLEQPYNLRNFFWTSILEQPYSLTLRLSALLNQPYSIRLLTALIQYYGDTPSMRRLLTQYYGSATLLHRSCIQPYDDYLKFVATLDQEWALPAALRLLIEQNYAISGEHLQALLAEPYSLNQYHLLRTLLDQVYVLPPSDSLVQTPVVIVTADDILIDPHHVSIEIDEANYAIRGEIHLASEADFLRCRHLQTTISVTIDATEYVLLVDSPRRSRPELGKTEYYVPCVSPTMLLDSPYAEPISREFAGAMAASIAAEMSALAGVTLDWQLLDWYIPAATLYANNETPLAVIRKLVEAVGGVIQTSPAGTLICRPEYPLSLPDWSSATPDFYLTDMDNFFSVDSTPVLRDGFNRYLISNQDATTAGLTLEAIDLTATSKQIRVYQVPWDEAMIINLHTSGGEWVSIVAGGVVTEDLTEQVEIVAGEGRTAKPFYGLVSYGYLQDDLGAPTISESGTVATITKDNSLLSLTYSTQYHQFIVTDARIEDVQFFPEEVQA
ncbi:MAG: SPRY domain-containing protein [Limnohabitans sp.]